MTILAYSKQAVTKQATQVIVPTSYCIDVKTFALHAGHVIDTGTSSYVSIWTTGGAMTTVVSA